jgi:hypothetical protein
MRVGGEPERGGNSHSVNPIFSQSYREQTPPESDQPYFSARYKRNGKLRPEISRAVSGTGRFSRIKAGYLRKHRIL